MIKRFLYIICFLGLLPTFTNATNIEGQVEIDNTWESLIYLSVINSFDDLNTASYNFLIARTEIDPSGNFEFNQLEIPNEDRLYRLHICKKGDPVSTIIIGGKNENFIHFIMKNGDSIQIALNPKSHAFQNSLIKGHPANLCLEKLFRIQKDLNSPPELPTVQNRQLLRQKALGDYSAIADSSKYAIIQLLAIYFINESFSPIEHIDLMKKIQMNAQASDTSSPYYKSFEDNLSYFKYQAKAKTRSKNIWMISIAIFILVLSVFLNKLFFGNKSIHDSIIDTSSLINQLSIQEKRVLDLLKEGKSNKEISQELHIEVSTVKSHLNKIYSRLGVKGRKEIVNSNW